MHFRLSSTLKRQYMTLFFGTVFKSLRFNLSTLRKRRVFKRPHYWNRFRTPPFPSTFTVLLVCRKGENTSKLIRKRLVWWRAAGRGIYCWHPSTPSTEIRIRNTCNPACLALVVNWQIKWFVWQTRDTNSTVEFCRAAELQQSYVVTQTVRLLVTVMHDNSLNLKVLSCGVISSFLMGSHSVEEGKLDLRFKKEVTLKLSPYFHSYKLVKTKLT